MANRAYLYVINKNETRIGDASEYPYDIPLFYKILLSEETELVESYIFGVKDLIAYKGSFDKGKNKYIAFLEYLYTLPNIDKEQIKKYINETINFFKTQRLGEWDKFLLEPGEYFDLLTDQFSLTNQGKLTLTEINEIGSDIDEILTNKPMDFLTRPSSKYWIKELQEDIKNIAPYWSEVCYFSFNSSLRGER